MNSISFSETPSASGRPLWGPTSFHELRGPFALLPSSMDRPCALEVLPSSWLSVPNNNASAYVHLPSNTDCRKAATVGRSNSSPLSWHSCFAAPGNPRSVKLCINILVTSFLLWPCQTSSSPIVLPFAREPLLSAWLWPLAWPFAILGPWMGDTPFDEPFEFA